MVNSMPESLTQFLEVNSIEASAPCRIDAGGTWDIKAMALPLESCRPSTVNIALNLRTRVKLSSYEKGMLKISSDGFMKSEVYSSGNASFTSSFGIFFAALSLFGYEGVEVRISSQAPVKSALGGSSTALVALLRALSKVKEKKEGKGLSKRELLHLAYHIEDGVGGGNCGMQDQAAAVYGGVNLWQWLYSRKACPFERTMILDGRGRRELSERILVAYSGKSHVSSVTNRKWIDDFLSGRTRSGWIKANEIVKELAPALKESEWARAAGLIKKEMEIRRDITPEAFIPETEGLIDEAERAGCGARFSGAGAGGAVWAIGAYDAVQKLRPAWIKVLKKEKGALMLPCAIDNSGAG